MSTPVTVLGLGPMGRALAGAFLDAGHPTTVWNRTPGKDADLVARGATGAATAAEAVAASPLVVLCVLDYAAGTAIAASAADALKGRTLVHLTADTPERARTMAAWAADHGIAYLDGAIMSPTVTIGGSDAVVLYSGPEDVHAAHRDTLAALGGTQTFLGTEPGRAAAHDLALLDAWWLSVAAFAHAFALAKAEDIRGRDFAPFAQGITALLPEIVTYFGDAADSGFHDGADATLGSAAASLDHILETSASHGLDSSLLRAAKSAFDRAVAAGHADEGISRLIPTYATEPEGA
ncbi:NAD(P)-dependent oxidoreductase [Actinomadura flavalba]|uniref:NAD(P)-dependent oxidoreductase n=1 Tax=Actinomadura flavalba TaxID=1120938 RepID=UPI00036B4662|nr:NAD(P)-binding domain-containing protein [Actinomadura flavalba]